MRRQVSCPLCQQDDVLRMRPHTMREWMAGLIWVAPFHCRHCQYRFLASCVGRSQYEVDRRKHFRIPVRLCLSFSGGKVRGEGTVMDLSVGGCMIESQTHVHVNDIFYLEIIIAGGEPPIEVAAMVRSVSSRGIAFKFLRNAQDNKQLHNFIQSHVNQAGSPALPTGESTTSR